MKYLRKITQKLRKFFFKRVPLNSNTFYPSFANHPLTHGEWLSDVRNDCNLWQTRDVLISTLRDIDRGNYKTKNCVLVFDTEIENEKTKIVINYTGDNFTATGLLAWAGKHI